MVQQPTSRELGFVQMRSKANQVVLDDYVERFRASRVYGRMFFVCHSPGRGPCNAGLLDWLSEKVD
jgi:hypothetical protein